MLSVHLSIFYSYSYSSITFPLRLLGLCSPFSLPFPLSSFTTVFFILSRSLCSSSHFRCLNCSLFNFFHGFFHVFTCTNFIALYSEGFCPRYHHSCGYRVFKTGHSQREHPSPQGMANNNIITTSEAKYQTSYFYNRRLHHVLRLLAQETCR